MRDISEIDRNFRSPTLDGVEIRPLDVMAYPAFQVEGFAWHDIPYYRLPASFTEKEINSGALELAHHTAGGVVRFRTDSPVVGLRAELAYSSDMNHMPRCGSAGFDLFRRDPDGELRFIRAVQPNRDQVFIESMMTGGAPAGMTEYWLNLPLYGGVRRLEICLAPEARVQKPQPHRVPFPILFYGSSITQGGCASRPGNAYSSLLCRKLDAEQINLGFSGSGRGEIALAREIGNLKLSCFVFDYDHNAPDAEHLEATHEPFFKAVRERNPELPVLFLSKCDFKPGDDERRRRIIRATCDHAVFANDRHVAFIDGETLFGNVDRDACTVDGCHPNDLGFYRMYRTVLPVIEQLLSH